MRATTQPSDGRTALPRFTFVVLPSLTESIQEGIDRFNERFGARFEPVFLTTDVLEDPDAPIDALRDQIRASAVVIAAYHSGKPSGVIAAATRDASMPVILLHGGGPDMMGLLRMGSLALGPIFEKRAKRVDSSRPAQPPSPATFGKILRLIERIGSVVPVGKLRHIRNWSRLLRYWELAGADNVCALLQLIGREYAGLRLPRPQPPGKELPWGFLDPATGGQFGDLRSYQAALRPDPARPTVGVLLHGGSKIAQARGTVRMLATLLRDRLDMNTVAVFATTGHTVRAIREGFMPGGRRSVDAVVSLRWFRLAQFSQEPAEAGVQALEQLGVPVYNGAPMYGRKISAWRDSVQGFTPFETLSAVILPELDGLVEPLPLVGLESTAAQGSTTTTVTPIPDRIERMVQRIERTIRLQRLPNAAKRVAFIIYNNPPGEDNLGNAAYLDTFESLRLLLHEMRNRGYRVEDIPQPSAMPELFLRQGLVNSPRWGGEDRARERGPEVTFPQYAAWLAKLPARDELAPIWGDPPGQVMVDDGRFLIPAIEFGNVLVAIQPSRGWESEPDRIAHDQTLPPHHQYTAFYRWLEESWRPDAMVHVGTHGTLEFLKGKEVGMSQRCWPEMLLGSTPHLYIYHVVNASEAIIAKRRTLGTCVNYNTPAFTSSGLYDTYAALEDLIAEHAEARALDPPRASRLAESIRAQAGELNLPAASLAEIHEELARMKRSIIPRGLHLFGADQDDQARLDFATFFLRYERGSVASLHRLLAQSRGWDYHALLSDPLRINADGQPFDALESLDQGVRELLLAARDHGQLPDDQAQRAAVQLALAKAGDLGGKLEYENLFAGLEGRFISPGLGGDPLRNPEVLPTGRNSFQFDPALIPSDDAIDRGWQIAENTLTQYHAAHGEFPRTTAVILWGFETTKTRGETIGQILAYLGVRVVSGPNPWSKDVRVVPLAELKRPRIDCHIQICGFFRDMYPNVVELLNRASALVSDLDEPLDANHVRAQTLALRARLEGVVPPAQRDRVASGRVYGPRPGEYGTRTTHLIETTAWKDEQQIAEVFRSSMNHLYADALPGVRFDDVYEQRLAAVDLVSQVRDSHEYEIVDLDHYYEFFGGLARTVESVRGEPPAMLISDTTREVIRTEAVGEALNRGVRTRLLNPAWIEPLLAHDYHGAQKIGERVENLVGFAATTHAVENWVWSAVTDRYIRDEELFQRMSHNNIHATEELMRRLFEAQQRGYWDATSEELELLRNRYLELEGSIEERIEA